MSIKPRRQLDFNNNRKGEGAVTITVTIAVMHMSIRQLREINISNVKCPVKIIESLGEPNRKRHRNSSS